MYKPLSFVKTATVCLALTLGAPVVAQELPTAMATIGITDINSIIDNASVVTEKFDAKFSAVQLKMLAGMTFNDPSLSGFGNNAGAVGYFTEDQSIVAFLEVSKDKAPEYVRNLKKMNISAEVIDDMVMLSTAKEKNAVSAAKKYAPLAKAYLSVEKAPAIEANMNVDAFLNVFGPQVDKTIATLEETAKKVTESKEATDDDKASAKFIYGVAMFINSFAKQLNVLELSFLFGQENFDINYAIEAKSGTNLANVIALPTKEINLDYLKYVPITDETVGYSVYTSEEEGANAKAIEFFQTEIEPILQKVGIDAKETIEKLKGLAKLSDEAFGSACGASSYDMKNINNNGQTQYFVFDLKDAAKAQALAKDCCTIGNDLLKTLFAKVTSNTISIKYNEKVGEYKSVPFDSITIEGIDALNSSIKMAAVNNKALLVVNGDLDKLIDLANTPNEKTPEVAALAKVPAGAKAVMLSSTNIGKMLQQVLEGIPTDKTSTESLAMFEANKARLTNLPTLSFFVAKKDNSIMVGTSIPSKFLVETAVLVKDIMNEQEAASAAEGIPADNVTTDSATTTSTK
ncbi:hypothetical protein GX645_04760 [Candidatus Sumerlaeota bacterium]|nr:hypothetical protein [Candidatus Sumerlaeota bacterium]